MEPELMVVAGAGGEAAAARVLLDDSRINRLILQARPAPRPLRLARRRCPAPGRVACVLLPCRPGEVLL
jgi:shikimate 5-dehydrogenase